MKYTRKDFGTSIGIGYFAKNDKKKSLYLINGNQAVKLAVFQSEETADMFQEVFEQFLGVDKKEQE